MASADEEKRTMARLVFLGTAAALPQANRVNTMLALFPEGAMPGTPGVLVDCGSGVYNALLRGQIQPDGIADLFITHAHIDHIGDLPSLIESYRLGGRRTPLRIWAIPEVLSVARRVVEVYSYELTLDDWTFPITFHEVAEGQEMTLGGIPARAARMLHTVPSAGLRFTLPHGDLTYTSDTQSVVEIERLGAGSKTLITECTFPYSALQAARASRHMTAREAGQRASACGVETLALVHLGLGADFTAEDIRTEVAREFQGRVLVPADGDELAV
jgi:ribonuclease BN (tRNA processing enzyme)